ncbi:MAG: hypothetical protein R3F59_28540 [Myxococcota bacterium]
MAVEATPLAADEGKATLPAPSPSSAWDYIELSNNDDAATALKNAAGIFYPGRRRRRDPVPRANLG